VAGKIVAVGAFEAKTRLSELLREAERGTSVVIRRRGKVVAWLIPPPRHEPWNPEQVLTGFQEIRRRVTAPMKIRELIEEGRRY
jgi:prevent-host-death family protein